jgi:hypothetical protein
MFSTFAATKETGEPNHCGRTGGASYWLALKPASDGVMVASTEGSGFNTLLAVYTSGAGDPAPLVEVASDDNSGRDGEDSYLFFPARAGAVYYVAVDGVNDAKGVARIAYSLDGPATLPRASGRIRPDGAGAQVQLEFGGSVGRSYRVEASNDLVHWSSLLTTNLTAAPTFQISDSPKRALRRFYRALPAP